MCKCAILDTPPTTSSSSQLKDEKPPKTYLLRLHRQALNRNRSTPLRETKYYLLTSPPQQTSILVHLTQMSELTPESPFPFSPALRKLTLPLQKSSISQHDHPCQTSIHSLHRLSPEQCSHVDSLENHILMRR